MAQEMVARNLERLNFTQMINAAVSTSPQQSQSSSTELKEQLSQNHPLYQLAEAINWTAFEQAFSTDVILPNEQQTVPTRLFVGLHYLKALWNEDDESVVRKWEENPYWQFFCGATAFQQHCPCHPDHLVEWREHIGSQGMETLLKEIFSKATINQALPLIPQLNSQSVDSRINSQHGITQLTHLTISPPGPDTDSTEMHISTVDGSDILQNILILVALEDRQYIPKTLQIGAKKYTLTDEVPITQPKTQASLPSQSESRIEKSKQAQWDQKELAAVPPGLLELSSRERDVLKLIMNGAKNKEIAKTLYIAEGTVRNHVSNILSRLNVRDRTQAAIVAQSFSQFFNDSAPCHPYHELLTKD